MYINFKVLSKSNIDFQDILFLVAIKQKEPQEIQELYYNQDIVEEWLSCGFLKRLKKGELRIDAKGEKFLKDLSSSVDISPETEVIVDWITRVYKGKTGGIIKNKTETKRRCSWFINETGIDKNRLALLLRCFIQDTYDKDCGKTIEQAKTDNPRLVLSQMADNIFWSPPNNFSRIYKLDESPLYTYYEDNTGYINKIWNENGEE